MRTNPTHLLFTRLAPFVFAAGVACNSEPAQTRPDGSGTSEFAAALKDLTVFDTWSSVDYTIGAVSPVLMQAHMGADPTYARIVWTNATPPAAGGSYPVGTVIVKETFSWASGAKKYADDAGLLAMVKRGGAFNPEGKGWEWIVLATDRSKILSRGGKEVMMGMCQTCHGAAEGEGAGRDSVFTHPASFAAADKDFADYKSWTKIGEASGPNPLLVQGAHKSDDPTAVRAVYRSPLYGHPDDKAHGYPVGTKIVKQVTQAGQITELLAMVKRGWGFNTSHNGWEWFMLDPSTAKVKDHGDSLMMGMCNSCHAQAEKPGVGKDYVFPHPNDPFNK